MTETSRQEKMKYRLAEAVKACMRTTPVDKITVKDIVDACGVTRQTFYRNFLDKYDLINWYFEKLVQRSFAEMGQGKTIVEGLVRKHQFIMDERVFFTGAFRSDDRNSLKEYDFEFILRFYTDLITRHTGRPLDDDLKFLLEMYCRGSVYMTVKWVLSGMSDTPQEIAAKLAEAVPPRLKEVFTELRLL